MTASEGKGVPSWHDMPGSEPLESYLLWKGHDGSCRPTPFSLRLKNLRPGAAVTCTQAHSWLGEERASDLTMPRPALYWNRLCFVPFSNSATTLIHCGSCSGPPNSLCRLVLKEHGTYTTFCKLFTHSLTWLQPLLCPHPATKFLCSGFLDSYIIVLEIRCNLVNQT